MNTHSGMESKEEMMESKKRFAKSISCFRSSASAQRQTSYARERESIKKGLDTSFDVDFLAEDAQRVNLKHE